MVFVARKVSLLRNRALFLVLIDGDYGCNGVIFMDKIEDNSLFHCSSRNNAE